MCGIAGVYLKPSTEDVERMLNKLIHRGPDGQGIKNLPNGTLGYTRLAILDIEGGHQPMGLKILGSRLMGRFITTVNSQASI